jgi:acetylglutamate kinase
MEDLKIIKLGGKVISEKKKLDIALSTFAQIQSKKILIHGGGNLASALAKKMNVVPNMIEGRRITDDAMLEIVTMVYGGSINKKIVAITQSMSMNSIGLSGADGNIILSSRRPVREIDYGHVGDIEKVNVQNLSLLLEAGFTPIICALTHDGQGNILNTNADTIASSISRAMALNYNTELIYGFEFQGVMEDLSIKDSLIQRVDETKFQSMKASNQINAGMIPKLQNAIQAGKSQVSKVFICSYEHLHEPWKGTEIC